MIMCIAIVCENQSKTTTLVLFFHLTKKGESSTDLFTWIPASKLQHKISDYRSYLLDYQLFTYSQQKAKLFQTALIFSGMFTTEIRQENQ